MVTDSLTALIVLCIAIGGAFILSVFALLFSIFYHWLTRD